MSVVNKATARVQGALTQLSDVAAPASEWLQEQREALSTRGEKLGRALAAGYLASLLTRSSAKRQP
jgi:hypothetical protein